MPTYAVTGATGHLGRLAIEDLLSRGVPATEIVAVARGAGRLADLAARGVEVREADYDRPETLPAALAGVRRLLLVSGSEPGRRVPQHTAVIEAARAAGVERIAYTSILRADTTGNPLAAEHLATERALGALGVPYTVLRNSWYTENYTGKLGEYLETGEIVGAAGSGRVSLATRADYAAAAVAALIGDQDPATVYELGGPGVDFATLAATITEVTGTPVGYRDLPAERFAAVLTGVGLDEGTARFVAAIDESIARGELETSDKDLTTLLGRPSTALADAIRAARA